MVFDILHFTTLNLLRCYIFMSSLLRVTKATTESVSAFSYVIGAPNGPDNWGKLNPNWKVCGTGKSQSPINIVTERIVERPSLGTLNRQYKSVPAVVRNKVYDYEVNWVGDAGAIIINGSPYKLVQTHWHIPAEHTFNGIRYNMELHMVHVNSRGAIAVVAIIYKLGPSDPFLRQIIPFPKFVKEQGFNLASVNPWDIMVKGKESYIRYNGSLTTPPCSQNVTWTVHRRVRTVGVQQLKAMQNGVKDGNTTGNARPSQPLNGRMVYSYYGAY